MLAGYEGWSASRNTLALPEMPSLAAAVERPPGFSEAMGTAERMMQSRLREYPGLALSVGVGEELVWSRGFGYSDLESRTPVSPSTRFRLYGVSQPLTAVAAARLWERGLLDLDAPVQRYVEGLPATLNGITPRLLLGHLSTIGDSRGGEAEADPCATVDDALDRLLRGPLASPPDPASLSCESAYLLLSAVVESAAGHRFDELMGMSLCTAAGMTGTSIEDPQVSSSQRATFYERSWFGRVKVARPVNNTCRWGAGAFLSTTDDLVRFGLGILNGRLLREKTLELLLSSIPTPSGQETGFGFGLRRGREEEGPAYAARSDGGRGGSAALVIIPEARVVVAILGNIEGPRLLGDALRIARAFAAGADRVAGSRVL